MNVHRAPQWFQKWQPHEEEAIVALLADGLTHKAVAREIGRTESGVRLRAHMIGAKSQYKHGKFIEPKPPLLITIPRADLVDYYANGWRVQGFDETSCLMLWPHKSDARYPK